MMVLYQNRRVGYYRCLNLLYIPVHRMDLKPGLLTRLLDGETTTISQLLSPVAAVAAIGNPSRFFETLLALGVSFNPYPFPDHHAFRSEELDVAEKTLVMTEKDAVKCKTFADGRMYFLPVDAVVGDEFWDVLWSELQKSLTSIKSKR